MVYIICYNHNAVITKQVVSSAFDTLSHCMETYMGQPFETNVSDKINESTMRNVIKNLRALIANPAYDFARGELMWDRVALQLRHTARRCIGFRCIS